MREFLKYTGLVTKVAWLFNKLTSPRMIFGYDESDLLYSDITLRAEIEFTTRCNLRCVYCSSTQPGWLGDDLDLQYLDHIVKVLQERKVLAVGVSGHGETTFVKDWKVHCDRMLDRPGNPESQS